MPLPANRTMIRNLATVAVAALLAVGCSGGGGGGGGGGAAPTPGSFVTAEFQSNWGLGAITAQNAYAAGGTGTGITVAVIDSGIDPTHPEFSGALSGASIDIVSPATPVTDVGGHGTAVAGVIGARRDGTGMHGVAYNSTIMAIRADTAGSCPVSGCSFTDSNLAAAIDHARANGARVINMSLGGYAPSSAALQQAIVNAVNAGIIIVASAGNDGLAFPTEPAFFAGQGAANGLILAVGATDASNALAGFSNQAGPTSNFFLVAPGVGITSTATGGGYVTANGTSFAAPHVSGAAAVLLQMFPSLTAQQVVQLLLSKATDLGAAGVDTVYGHGLLNLAAAIAPAGTVLMPTSNDVNGAALSLEGSRMSLGAAFGDALAASVLDRAIVLDSYQRPYLAGLGERVTAADPSFGLEAFVRRHNIERIAGPELGGLSLAVNAEERLADPSLRPLVDDRQEDGYEVSSLDMTLQLGGGADVRVGHMLAPQDQAALTPALSRGGGLFWAENAMVQPQLDILSRGNSVAFNQPLGAATSLSLLMHRGDTAVDGDPGSADGTLGQLSLTHRFGAGLDVRVGLSALAEDTSFLGSSASGVFGNDLAASSNFMTAASSYKLGDRFELFGSLTLGVTEMPGATGSVLTDWSRVQSSAFAAGMVMNEVLTGSDRLGLMIGQPLRVDRASAQARVPVARTLDGAVVYADERVDVVPTGRELDLQLAYQRSLGGGADVAGWAMVRHEPGHDAEAGVAYGVGMKLDVAF